MNTSKNPASADAIVTTTATPVSSVASLIASKQVKPGETSKTETDRFMLVLDRQTRDELRNLCEELDVKQISFASELFTVALKEAINQVKLAKATPAIA